MRSDILALATPAVIFVLFLNFSLPTSGANPNRSINSEADIEAGEYCVDCHDEYESNLTSTAHASAMLPHKLEMSCISCHSGAAVHVEDPNVDNIGNPSAMLAGDVLAVCTQCHQPHMELDNAGFDPHVSEGLSCLSCHSIHQGQDKLLLDDGLVFCSQCHTGVANQFIKSSNHPLIDGAVNCISCHDFTGKIQPMFAHGAAANCISCHPTEGGPYLYEHAATGSFATEGGEGCISCHQPHGSSSERLLARHGNNLLCQQCHSTPVRHFTAHNGEGAMFDCTECHSSIHGSNTNKWFLDPSLAAKIPSSLQNCACHNVSG